MKTIKKYESDTYKDNHMSIISEILEIEGTTAIVFHETIFYPQGGGQPSDMGEIKIDNKNYFVKFVSKEGDKVLHFLDGLINSDDILGKEVYQHIDRERRLTNARYHSAGHLITNILEKLNDDMLPAKGHHFPNEANIEMDNCKSIDTTGLIDILNKKLREDIQNDYNIMVGTEDYEYIELHRPELAKMIPQNKKIRTTQIGGYKLLPCGGTHVKSIGELGNVTVTKIKRKKGRLKVSYSL